MGQDQLIFPRKLFSLSGRYPNQKRGKSLATGISTGTYFLNSTYNESRINSARLQIAEKYKLFITGGEDVYIKNIISGSVPNTPVQDTGVCKMIFHTPFHFSNFPQKLTPESDKDSCAVYLDNQRRVLRSCPSFHRTVPEPKTLNSTSLSSTPLHICDLNRKPRYVQYCHCSESSKK